MTPRLYTFSGGELGDWQVSGMHTVAGEPLPKVNRVSIIPGTAVLKHTDTGWSLRGIMSNERYVARDEKAQLVARQEGLGRPSSTCAALIPIRKNALWWALAQDDRRAILEEQSRHIHIGLQYLPAIARRLHHCRDLSESEPFDFLTWFEFSPEHETEFDALLRELRASLEWTYVAREVDIRLRKTES